MSLKGGARFPHRALALPRSNQPDGDIGLHLIARVHFDSAVSAKQRSTSATLHACAMQPRGVNGASASNTSLIDPTQPSFR